MALKEEIEEIAGALSLVDQPEDLERVVVRLLDLAQHAGCVPTPTCSNCGYESWKWVCIDCQEPVIV